MSEIFQSVYFGEILGYIASVLVAISLMMSNILWLRWINMAGAITFVVYGVAIEAYPVVVMNAFITGVNVYYLRKIYAENSDIGNSSDEQTAKSSSTS